MIGGQHTSERGREGAQGGSPGGVPALQEATSAARGITGSDAPLVPPAGQQVLNQANALGLSPKKAAGPEYKSTCISTWKGGSTPLPSQLLAAGADVP